MVQWCKDGFPMLPFNTAPHHPNKMLTQHHAKVRKALCRKHLEVSEQHLDDVIFLMNPILKCNIFKSIDDNNQKSAARQSRETVMLQLMVHKGALSVGIIWHCISATYAGCCKIHSIRVNTDVLYLQIMQSELAASADLLYRDEAYY